MTKILSSYKQTGDWKLLAKLKEIYIAQPQWGAFSIAANVPLLFEQVCLVRSNVLCTTNNVSRVSKHK